MILIGGTLQGLTQRYPGAVIAQRDENPRETQPSPVDMKPQLSSVMNNRGGNIQEAAIKPLKSWAASQWPAAFRYINISHGTKGAVLYPLCPQWPSRGTGGVRLWLWLWHLLHLSSDTSLGTGISCSPIALLGNPSWKLKSSWNYPNYCPINPWLWCRERTELEGDKCAAVTTFQC